MPTFSQQLVRIHPQPPGAYTAEVVGLPDVQATAGSADAAVREVRKQLEQLLASGQLRRVELGAAAPPPVDPNDPLEQEFLADLEHFRQKDLEPTPTDHDPPCSSSSSTPTT
jgi:hypothetical protein